MSFTIKPGIGHLDALYSKFVYTTVPFWHAINITPNVLTTFGLISSIACVYFVHRRNTVLSIVFLLLRMYFDYADGIKARKYNQTSKFGDWYDHIVDVLFFFIPLVIVLLMTENKWVYIIPVVIFTTTTVINIGCIEKLYNEKTGEGGKSLEIAQKFCFSPEVFRWLDNSVLYIVIIIVIIVLCRKENNSEIMSH